MTATDSLADCVWMLLCACLVMLMQAGFCCLETGLVRAKNSINVAIKNLFDFCIASLLYWAVGFGLMFGTSWYGLVGTSHFLPEANSGYWLLSFLFFQLVFCGTSTTIISGAVAERMRFSSYVVISVLVSGLFYPVFGHWAWGGLPGTESMGWLKRLGFLDFAGSTVVHSLGGWLSLAAILVLGKRQGQFEPGKPPIHGFNLPLTTLGVFLLWFGWFGFNGGSTFAVNASIPQILLNTNLAAATGGIAALAVAWPVLKRPDVPLLMNGVLAGLVSVTASCNLVDPAAALVIGAIGGVVSVLVAWGLERLKIDDAVGAVPVHGFCGAWGTLAVALFADASQFASGSRGWQLLIQSAGVLVCMAWGLGFGYVVLASLNRLMRLRVTPAEELAGLNHSEHQASTPLIDLLHDMEDQRLTGDFTRAVEVEPHTEVGQIALQYNRVVERAQDEIRSREEVMQALRTAEEKYRSIFENAVEGIFQTTPDGQYLSANPTLARIYGYDSVGEMQKAIRDIQHQLYVDPKRRQDFAEQIKADGVVRNFESQVFRADGKVIWISENARVIRDAEGKTKYYEGTVEEISERKQAQELMQQKEAALAASSAKSEFLARMSHEIRTPLNGVIGMLELLQGTHMSQQQQRYARVAKNSADTLLTLVNDILDFSKIEAGKLELDHTDFDLHALLEDTAELFAERAADKGLELVCHICPDLPASVHGDPDRLRQIVVNLLNNALKFTTRGQVVLRANLDDKQPGSDDSVQIRFCVEDTGIGIPADRTDRLFQSFSQVDISTTRKYGGTGLGLAICRELVGLFGGEIGVNSVLNKGSQFWFHLPLKKQPKEQQRKLIMPQELASVRVLAVDDNQTNRELLHEQFASWGLALESVCGGREALEKLAMGKSQNRPFQLVLLDFNMPGMDGLELARAIRLNPEYQAARLVMLSSSGTLFDDPRLARSGLSACLPKPVRQSKLFDIVIEMFGPQKKASPAKPLVATPRLKPAQKRDAKILVAEDNEVNQQVVSEILAAAGFDCQLVSNGRWAFDEVQKHVFDLVLMDCQMPEMDGFETTRAIRKKETSEGSQRHLPIIALTANAVAGDRERCLNAGMDGYVTKPINPTTLIDAIENLLSQVEFSSVAKESETTSEPTSEATPDSLESFVSVPVLDIPPLRARCMHDDSFLQRVLGKALTRIPADVMSIVTAVEQTDFESLARSAHALAGMSANLEAQQLLAAARSLENIAKRQQADDLPALLVELRTAATQTEAALEQLQRSIQAESVPA
ncbi:ammonium transporter [Anatilimnocola sp. NA78]|uniref:ammonium transporter n=1 Tax=Anatilimnocola sp. NA78 TaxID=3415683 RepID=UPI003CE522CE